MLAAAAWGAVVAPKAPVAVPPSVRWAVEGVVFGLVVAGLAGTGHPRLAWAVNRVPIAVTRPAAGAPPR